MFVSQRIHNSIIDNYCSSPVYYIALLSTGWNKVYRSIPAWVCHVLWVKNVVSLVLGGRNKFLILHKVTPLVAWQRLVKGLAYKANVWTWFVKGFFSLKTWWVSLSFHCYYEQFSVF